MQTSSQQQTLLHWPDQSCLQQRRRILPCVTWRRRTDRSQWLESCPSTAVLGASRYHDKRVEMMQRASTYHPTLSRLTSMRSAPASPPILLLSLAPSSSRLLKLAPPSPTGIRLSLLLHFPTFIFRTRSLPCAFSLACPLVLLTTPSFIQLHGIHLSAPLSPLFVYHS